MAAEKSQKSDALLDAALALRPKEVSPLNIDPIAARGPVKKGIAVISDEKAELKKKYPGIDVSDFESLLPLLDRVAEQQRLVQLATSSNSLAITLPIAQAWRKQLLGVAQGLAAAGKVNGKTVAAIESGMGASDSLRDVKDLVTLLTPFKAQVESLFGKDALTLARSAADAGLASLGGEGADDKALRTARDLRDRYATLFSQRWDRLKAAVAVLFGYREVERLVPALSQGGAKKQPDTVVPPPKPV
jgi:hypothetical protein